MPNTVCFVCGRTYPTDGHTVRCPRYLEVTPLENQIVQTIHAHAFVPLHDRYRIARQLIADGWRPS
ncbi:hypothetical protein KNU62_gp76 [Gordonia phage Bakery]|uniref:Uncharacterized protein n=1 Tax=Gordonia phage Bakery TaxID=2591205 RepID=A0A514DGW8_9CAUD|nr:hypothetical protein KNU62_gp76 [Gordonia phage Bakery]QDH92861.1 hypothetical protein SEA_BAKERY_76 [Gordonia phage Bakery]